MCVTLFCLVYPVFLFCFYTCVVSSMLRFLPLPCCLLSELVLHFPVGVVGLTSVWEKEEEERLFASDAGSWYTVSDVDCSEDSSDDGNDDVDDDSTTSVDGSDDDEEEEDDGDDDDDRFTLQRCRRRVRNVIVSDTDSDNSGA